MPHLSVLLQHIKVMRAAFKPYNLDYYFGKRCDEIQVDSRPKTEIEPTYFCLWIEYGKDKNEFPSFMLIKLEH